MSKAYAVTVYHEGSDEELEQTVARIDKHVDFMGGLKVKDQSDAGQTYYLIVNKDDMRELIDSALGDLNVTNVVVEFVEVETEQENLPTQ